MIVVYIVVELIIGVFNWMKNVERYDIYYVK